MNATLFDYGAGNLHSVTRAFRAALGIELKQEQDLRACMNSDLLVLPGVGAFPAAAAAIAPVRTALRDALRTGLPCVGICLGMQLLFEESDEGPGRGLALLSGRVSKLSGACVPHMGWTKVSDAASPMYFAHGYECTPADFQTVRSVAYFEGRPLVASVRVANTVGLQFHPEKSSAAGLTYLAGVVREVLA